MNCTWLCTHQLWTLGFNLLCLSIDLTAFGWQPAKLPKIYCVQQMYETQSPTDTKYLGLCSPKSISFPVQKIVWNRHKRIFVRFLFPINMIQFIKWRTGFEFMFSTHRSVKSRTQESRLFIYHRISTLGM